MCHDRRCVEKRHGADCRVGRHVSIRGACCHPSIIAPRWGQEPDEAFHSSPRHLNERMQPQCSAARHEQVHSQTHTSFLRPWRRGGARPQPEATCLLNTLPRLAILHADAAHDVTPAMRARRSTHLPAALTSHATTHDPQYTPTHKPVVLRGTVGLPSSLP
jgi:hypothetical protein